MNGHNWRSDRLAVTGLAMLAAGSILLIVKLLLDVAHIIGAGLVLAGLVLVAAGYFSRKG